MSQSPGKFVWFEHSSTDIPKARKFYEALLGWHTESVAMGDGRYDMIFNGNESIGGYRSGAASARSQWLSYLSVEDVDMSYQVALSAGAKSISAPMNYGNAGRGASITDPTGAPFSLWKGTEGDRPDVKKTPAGAWYWNELWTPDDKKALAFYERAFGYSHDSMNMGPQGIYYILKKNGVSRAGLMRSTEPKAPPMWLPYVAVDDCDASAAKAKTLGGQIVSGPTDIPGIGRFAIVVDTLGAAISIMRGIEPAT